MSEERLSRKEQRRLELERQKRRRNLLIGAVVAIVVVGLGAFAFIRLQPVEGVVDHGHQERGHEEEIEYLTVGLPPVGGVHNPRWQNCGIYEEPVDDEYAVHSMEHGAVWITYRPDLPAEQLATLHERVRGETYLLLSPFETQETDVVMTAWGVQLELDGLEDARFADFIDRYRGNGPENAACTGGIGNPIG